MGIHLPFPLTRPKVGCWKLVEMKYWECGLYFGQEVPSLSGGYRVAQARSLGRDGELMFRYIRQVVKAGKPTPGSLTAWGGILTLPLC